MLYTSGLLPFGRDTHRMSFGNKLQLWLAAPAFWFGLNPFWLKGMIQQLLKVRKPKAPKRATDDITMQPILVHDDATRDAVVLMKSPQSSID
jgi:hypothetical protein